MNTSWQQVAAWYDKLVSTDGHYFHREIIFPNLFNLFEFDAYSKPKLLDLASGNGVLAGLIPDEVEYMGLDYAKSLVTTAGKKHKRPFKQQDVTKPFLLKTQNFTHITLILALQNMDPPSSVFRNAHKHLKNDGKFYIVLNHPCFRIPRQTHWNIDQKNKIQYRRIDRYFSPLKIPIQMSPSKKEKSQNTYSFHYPLSDYVNFLSEEGFVLSGLHEWTSDKLSMGKLAKMENRARKEFPLFLCLVAEKK